MRLIKLEGTMTTEAEEVRIKVTPAMWAEIEAKWASGEYTLSRLEDEYGLRRETFSRYFKKKGLAKGADSVGKMVRESLKSDAEIRAKERADKIDDRRNKYDSWAFTLGRMAMGQVAEAKSKGTSLAVIEGDLKSIQRASNILAKCFDVSSKALGMDKDEGLADEIPNLVFGELTPNQVAELRKSEEPDLIDDDELEALEEEAAKDAESVLESEADDDSGEA